MVVITRTQSGLFPAEFPIERYGGGVGFGDFKKNRSACFFAHRSKQGGGNAATPEAGIHGQIQDLGFVFGALPPRTETGRGVFDQCKEKRKSRIIAERPLRGFRAVVLDAGYGRVIAFECGTDCDRAQFREPGTSERPASGCTAELPQMATPVRTSAFRKLLSMA